MNDFLEKTINYLKFYNEKVKLPIEIDFNKCYSGDTNIKESENITLKDKEEKFKSITIVEEENLFAEEWEKSGILNELYSKIKICTKCNLYKTRTNFVFGSGNENADIVVIGEAPGSEEDLQGQPFVGRAGQLLTKMLSSININRDEVYICNILKCRPPGNRNPLPEEIKLCEPYLIKQLKLINPEFIIALGSFAAQTLLKTKEPLGRLREKVFNYNISGKGIKLIVTFHPAALLRNPHWKKPAWEDLKMFRAMYDEYKKSKS